MTAARPDAMDPRDALRSWLRQAVAAYGGDLPVPIPGRISVPAAPTGPAAPAPPPPPPGAAPDPRPGPAEAEDAAPIAVTAAAGPETDLPQDLEALRRMVTTCRRCKLCEHRTQTVFGEGPKTAEVMFVGEAPGAREDEQGRPFVGPAGRLLTRIIENAMGLRREEVYIANVNKCRPPGNRNPEPDEVAACLPFLRAQIRAVRPRVLVALGRVAAHNLLGQSLPMAQLRRRELSYEGVPVVATWHPAYLLRTPEAKRETWEDIKRVNRLLGRPEDPRNA
jgi:DNA polymerase